MIIHLVICSGSESLFESVTVIRLESKRAPDLKTQRGGTRWRVLKSVLLFVSSNQQLPFTYLMLWLQWCGSGVMSNLRLFQNQPFLLPISTLNNVP